MGYIHVYTGDGKGKTTAALGLALRAYGAGLKVLFAQFLKKGDYSELKALERLSDGVSVRQYGTGAFVGGSPTLDDFEAARKGMEETARFLKMGEYDLVVLDEANVALFYDLIRADELIAALRSRDRGVEVVITGRNAPHALMEFADLVTDMREVKHYYGKGVKAREGIEK